MECASIGNTVHCSGRKEKEFNFPRSQWSTTAFCDHFWRVGNSSMKCLGISWPLVQSSHQCPVELLYFCLCWLFVEPLTNKTHNIWIMGSLPPNNCTVSFLTPTNGRAVFCCLIMDDFPDRTTAPEVIHSLEPEMLPFWGLGTVSCEKID